MPDADACESLGAFATGWGTLVTAVDPDADVREPPGIVMRWADSPFMFWRTAALTDVDVDAELLGVRLHEAAEIMRAKPRPGVLWVFENLLAPEARAALPVLAGKAGLGPALPPGSGQAGDILPIPEPRHPGLTFRRVRTAEQVRTVADLNALAYGIPIEDVRDGWSRLTGMFTTQVHSYLGLSDGVPVTTASTVECDGRLFLIFVATPPRYARHGYAEAVCRKALSEGGIATGLRRAILHATAQGAPVYPRIGFVPNTPVHYLTTLS